MWSAPKSGSMFANIIVAIESFGGSLRQYADATVTGVKTSSPAAQKVFDVAF